MDNRGRITCAEVRDIDMVEYLAGLNIQPVRIMGNDFWYLSPLRNERTASFKINRKINRWYDFGEGCGGNLIDFAIRYNNCTVGEFLRSLSGNDFSFFKPTSKTAATLEKPKPKITILNDRPIFSYPLLNYLKERRIPIDIADKFCREVKYKIDDREYYAIGFKNNSDGWELRNPYFKGSSYPKDVTKIRNGFEVIAVFEGFIDLLSFIAIIKEPNIDMQYDFMVLNSLALMERARKVMERYRSVYLFFDNDEPGRNYTQYVQSLGKKYEDKSHLYKNHKDINDWLCNTGKLKPP